MLGHEFHVEVRGNLDSTQMYVEDFYAFLEFGELHVYLAVEAPGTHKGLVENVRPVGSSQHYNAAVGAETVHLGKQLIERVLPFVIRRPAHVLAPGTPYGVYFVDEDYARGLFLGLGEEVAACAHAHEHLHEIRAADGEERHVGLPCHSLGKQGLTRAGRAYQEGTLGYLSSEGSVFLGILEEVHDFHHFLFGSVEPGNVLEGDVDSILIGEFAGGAAYVEDPSCISALAFTGAHSVTHTARHPDPHQDKQYRPDQPVQGIPPHFGIILHHQFHGKVFELFLGVELVGDEEGEMRRFGGNLACGEKVGIFAESLGLDGY